ncbi:hypothetical protein Rhe02_95710 [Rhizocola hellebori]|uniref:Uncharacterized protein n=1 Tax=Rhizocola hellebori TaxID=1392758 RepID=A0A8J3QI25_9ACTN|nr:type VII secretion target [Rhizocola hellebori]GIH11504.1 hypothetical protein Rhe02_95710 [Rhizocola hellebori]
MRLDELARRLEIAADGLAHMRSELASEDPLKPPGRGPAQELITMVNSAWAQRQTNLASLTSEVTELADGVRLAAERYAATDGSHQWMP